MQGAGGMVMIDPAFQRALAELCQQRNIPVIFDEVFSGLWRLGHLTAAHMLGLQPDIACYAKLLTGETALIAFGRTPFLNGGAPYLPGGTL